MARIGAGSRSRETGGNTGKASRSRRHRTAPVPSTGTAAGRPTRPRTRRRRCCTDRLAVRRAASPGQPGTRCSPPCWGSAGSCSSSASRRRLVLRRLTPATTSSLIAKAPVATASPTVTKTATATQTVTTAPPTTPAPPATTAQTAAAVQRTAPSTPAQTTPAAPPAPPASTAPASCYPLSNEGHCYEPGEFCRASDHGATGVAGDGKAIKCEDNDGWRWEPA